MNLTNNLKNIAVSMQQTASRTSVSIAQRFLRALSGFFIGLVLALIVQELTKSGDLMMAFLTFIFMVIVYKLLRRLQIFQILIFDLICVLLAALLRMYIMLAP